MPKDDEKFFNDKELAIIFLLQGKKILSNAKKYRKLLNAEIKKLKKEVKSCNHFIFYTQDRMDEIKKNVPSAAQKVEKIFKNEEE